VGRTKILVGRLRRDGEEEQHPQWRPTGAVSTVRYYTAPSTSLLTVFFSILGEVKYSACSFGFSHSPRPPPLLVRRSTAAARLHRRSPPPLSGAPEHTRRAGIRTLGVGWCLDLTLSLLTWWWCGWPGPLLSLFRGCLFFPSRERLVRSAFGVDPRLRRVSCSRTELFPPPAPRCRLEVKRSEG
jgi:hypothetical protein